jgi:hypothetical protein
MPSESRVQPKWVISENCAAEWSMTTGHPEGCGGGVAFGNHATGHPSHVAPREENPTSKKIVHDWIAERVARDAQQRAAGAARRKKESR